MFSHGILAVPSHLDMNLLMHVTFSLDLRELSDELMKKALEKEKKEKDAPTLGDLILDNIPIFKILVGLSIFAIYNRFTNHG